MVSLPPPTGRFSIGTTTRHLVDESRRDLFDPDSKPRELIVQLWYPSGLASGRSADAGTAPYLDDVRTLEPLADLMGLPRGAFAHLATLRTHGIRDGALAADEAPFPVLLFSHGRCGVREHNTFQVEELASRGYVVATIDHPHAASGVRFPDGRIVFFDRRLLPPWPRAQAVDPEAAFLASVIPFLAEDVRFALRSLATINADPRDRFGGRLDLDRVGAFGVSLGGVVAAQASVGESAIRALLIMDGYVPPDALRAGLRLPVMWLSRDAATMRREGWDEYDVANAQGSMRAAFDGLPRDGYIVLVPGMYHVDFSDGPLLSPLIAEGGLSGPVDQAWARRVQREYAVAFFDRHLRGLPGDLLDRPPADAGRVLLESRRQFAPVPMPVGA